MKILKILFLFLISLFLVIFLYLTNSSFVVQKIFDYASQELPIKYKEVNGTLFSGISIKDLNYEDNLKISNLYIKPELLALLVSEIYIKELKIDGIKIDNKLFEKENEEETTSTKLEIPLKLIIKKLEATLENYSYENYKIEKLNLKAKDINSDLNSFLSGIFDIETNTNIANLKASINLNKNIYKIYSNIDLNKEFIDKNYIKTTHLDSFNLKANGDLKKIDFKVDTKKLSINLNKPLELNNISTSGTYDFSTFNLDINSLNSLLNYNFINSKIDANLSLKNNDINSLIFNSNLNTTINKTIFDKLQKDLKIKSKLSGNLKEIKFLNTIEENNLTKNINFDGVTKLSKDKINIQATLNPNIENLGLINIDTIYKKDLLDINLKSKIANLTLESKDLKKYLFNLDLKKINPNDFYKLDKKIKITNLKGKLSGEYESNLKIKGNLSLNNSFEINTNITSSKDEIKGNLSSKSFNTDFFVKEEKTTIKAQIKELGNFEKELHKIVEIPKLYLSGLVNLKAQIENSDILFEVNSPKISLEKESIEKIDLKGNFKEDIITFNTLNFYISTIYDVTLNKNFILKKESTLNINTLNGNFNFDNIVVSTSKENEEFNIKIDTENLSILHNEYGKAYVTSNISLTINDENKIFISGDVRANKLNIFYKIPNMSISRDRDIIIVYKNKNKKQKDAFFEDIALQLSIFADNLTYKVQNIDLKASTILVLKKEFNENLKIFGSVQEVNGTFTELGKTYNIEDSNIYFRGLEPVDPILDIHATNTINDIDISIIISGTSNEPRINLSSNPVMTQKEILSYLIFGTNFSSNSQTNSQSKQAQASLFLLNELSKDYAKELGVDMLYFQYDPTTQYIETYIGKNLSEKNKVILKNKSTGGELIFLRELTKLWNVELGFEEKSQSLDLIYKKRY